MNAQILREGTKVQGTFHGVAYTGVVTMCRAHTLHPTMVKMYVDFDQEIDCGPVFGKRTSGIVNSFYESVCEHTIEVI